MIRISFIACLLFSYLQTQARHPQIQYYNLVNYGEYLKYKGDYTKAYAMYQQAFALEAHKHAKDYLTAASLGLRLSDNTAALHYLELASREPIGFNDLLIKSDSTFYNALQSRPEWATRLEGLLSSNEKITQQFIREIRMPFDTLITQWLDSDQHYTHIRRQYMQMATDNPFRVSAERIDSMFYERYYNFIKVHGYPGWWVSNTDILECINVHIGWPDLMKRFKSLLIAELEEGHLIPTELTACLDRFQYAFKNECGFGLYSADMCDLERDWQKIVALRLEYGMGIFIKEPRRVFNKDMTPGKLAEYVDLTIFEKMLFEE